MNEIALIANRHTVTCFMLAGLSNLFSAETSKEAGKILFNLLKNNNLRIILVSECLLSGIKIFKNITEAQKPSIIPIPDLQGPKMPKTDLISEVIKQKTGIEVKF